MTEALSELQRELRTIADLESAAAVLEWDQSTYMPPGGATARGRQIALLGRLAHERRIAARMTELLDALRSLESGDTVEGALVRKARRDHDRARCIPAELVDEIKTHGAASYVAWTKARPANDFGAMRPYLEKTLALSRRVAECFPKADHIADPLIAEHDPGMSAASVRALFDALRTRLVPLAQKILARPTPERGFLAKDYPEAGQLAIARRFSEALGYDFERGRLDLTHHPFMIRFAAGDIRITTRVSPREPTDCLFSTIHETGHALYEQHIDPALDASPLGQGTSAGVHESQSRLWENLVARSRPFWRAFYPWMQEAFPEQLGDVDLDTFHKAVNTVERSLIRTEADEVTYNLHVMLRFDLELRMLEGDLAVKDLPDAWNERMASDLGVTPPDDRQGVLQDVHWYCTTIGGTFQGYTLGNLMSAQFFAAAERAVPDVWDRIGAGDLAPLRHWLAENVYRPGARFLPAELVEKATGAPLSVDPFIAYLEKRFTPLYDL